MSTIDSKILKPICKFNEFYYSNLQKDKYYSLRKKKLPNVLSQKIQELLIDYPNGLQLNNFENVYRKFFGSLTPLGFSNIKELISSLDNVLVSTLNGKEFIHLAKCKIKTHPKDLLHYSRLRSNHVSFPKAITHKFESPNLNTLPNSVIKNYISNKSIDDRCPLSQTTQLIIHKQNQQRSLANKLQIEITSILRILPKDVTIGELEKTYKTFHGFILPFKEAGFNTTKELLLSLWPILKLNDIEGRVFVYLCQSLPVNNYLQTKSTYFINYSAKVSEEVCNFIRLLLLSWPSGMPLIYLPEKYNDVYRQVLPIHEFGFNDILTMMFSIPNYVRISFWKREADNIEHIIHAIPLSNSEIENNHFSLMYKFTNVSTPEVVNLAFQKQELPPTREFKVHIGHISTPHRFWLQLDGPLTSLALVELLDEMEIFYNGLHTQSECLDNIIVNPFVGLSCVAPYYNDGFYYRAQITKTQGFDQAEIYYVDYGNKLVVPKGSLRKINGLYMLLPAQAIICRLYSIQPSHDQKWTNNSSLRLREITNNANLFCHIVNVDNDGFLSILLYKKVSNYYISINEQLVSEGLAISIPENIYDINFHHSKCFSMYNSNMHSHRTIPKLFPDLDSTMHSHRTIPKLFPDLDITLNCKSPLVNKPYLSLNYSHFDLFTHEESIESKNILFDNDVSKACNKFTSELTKQFTLSNFNDNPVLKIVPKSHPISLEMSNQLHNGSEDNFNNSGISLKHTGIGRGGKMSELL